MGTPNAGYSGTPLARKLGIREGRRVLLADPPSGLVESLEPLPPGAIVVEDPDGLPQERYDVVLLFCPDAAALHQRFASAVTRIRWDGGLWACWPKKSSNLYVDLAREEVRAAGLTTGLVDNKICAVDEDWSGLRFVVRTEDRPEPGADGGPTPP